MPEANSTIEVVPLLIASRAPIWAIKVFSSPCSRRVGDSAGCAALGKPKSSLKPRSKVAVRWVWQLIKPGRTALPRPSTISALGYCARTCLLYTSDAADDLLCVDLGGRRI